jgi:hypothetical protein
MAGYVGWWRADSMLSPETKVVVRLYDWGGLAAKICLREMPLDIGRALICRVWGQSFGEGRERRRSLGWEKWRE